MVLHLEPETDNIEIQRTRRYTVNFKQATAIKVIKPQRIIKNNIEDYKESTLGYSIYLVGKWFTFVRHVREECL